jgi:beta-N-acetylhexosaminidase
MGQDAARLGQLFMLGFRGTTLSADHWLVEAVRDQGLGGVILFDRNVDGTVQNVVSPDQLRTLVDDLQGLAPLPLLVGIDQEGGRVCRLKERDGFAPCASAASLGSESPAVVGEHAEALAAMLAHCGVNLNFAPVVDLDLNPANPIIGRYQRSFGVDPATVVACARAFVEAHHRLGVGCCLKHFPGHGSAGGDSHLGFVDVTGCWQAVELEPYRMLLAAGYTDGIMTAHLVHRGLDPSGLPATLSPAIITGLLRDQLGHQGVVFSDDLQMRAISDGWTYAEAVQQALLAGVDVLVVGNNLAPCEDALTDGIRAVADLLDSGRIDAKRIEDSLARIALFKERIAGERLWQAIDPPTVG